MNPSLGDRYVLAFPKFRKKLPVGQIRGEEEVGDAGEHANGNLPTLIDSRRHRVGESQRDEACGYKWHYHLSHRHPGCPNLQTSHWPYQRSSERT
ncbi:MAG: hypothetical protein H6821_05240 [Planctomycetaceae bacterium]|nr:hypothetical protein [Planctomycetaceae bacterium]